MELNACAASPLSLRERVGVRAPFATKPAVEKAAPFSMLGRHGELMHTPVAIRQLRLRVAVGWVEQREAQHWLGAQAMLGFDEGPSQPNLRSSTTMAARRPLLLPLRES